MTKQISNTGISAGIQKLKAAYGLNDDQLAEVLGDHVLTAMLQDDYNYITIGDMQKIADRFGLVFIMNFRSIDSMLGSGEEDINGQ